MKLHRSLVCVRSCERVLKIELLDKKYNKAKYQFRITFVLNEFTFMIIFYLLGSCEVYWLYSFSMFVNYL